MGNCCNTEKPAPSCSSETSAPASSCCDTSAKKRIDWLFWLPFISVIFFYALHILTTALGFELPSSAMHMSHGVFDLMNTMALGLLIGITMVALLSYVPRELVMGALGTGSGLNGILRATAAGVLLDLCSHGILMVGAKLYERGVSIGQVMAFLIASPWNSLSLTVILVALIGLGWTLAFIVLSVVVAVITGLLFNWCVSRGVLPHNPNTETLPEDFKFWPSLRSCFSNIEFSASAIAHFIATGIRESRTVIKWLFIGVIIAAAIRTFVNDESFGTYFGPSILGLAITMLAATIIEVCSEGSAPIAADIMNRANAPGNGFAFLMAGVSTDYTEVMILRSTTKSWKIALFLPLLTLPQIAVIAIILNSMV